MLTFTLFLIGFLLTLFPAIYSRCSNGVGLKELIQTRFYEIIPVRALLWLMVGVAIECCVIFIYLLGREALTLYDQELLFTSSSVSLLPFISSACISAIFVCFLLRNVIPVTYRSAPTVDIGEAKLSSQISQPQLASLGAERFPNNIDPEGKENNAIRWVVTGASIAVIVAVVLLSCAVFAGWITIEGEMSARSAPQNAVATVSAVLEIAVFFLWTAAVSFALLLFNNRDYTFLSFRRSLIYQGAFISLIAASLYIISNDIVYVVISIVVGLSLCALRAWRDLRLERKYRKFKEVADPITSDLKRLTPYLNQVSAHPDFKLPELDPKTLGERITRGCVNVEERGLFVARSFARSMRVVEVEKQNFTAGMLRYLMVDRKVSLSAGAGTSESYRHPQVPIWNLQLFPISSPESDGDDGFRDVNDALTLGHEWDVVQTCSNCGGSGWVWETETYYETEYYTENYTDHNGQSASRQASRQVTKTRQVQRTCSSCSGAGRTRHRQILNTLWRTLIVRATDPEIPLPELVENAEEERFFHYPLTAEFEPVSLDRENFSFDDPLVNRMIETGKELATLHPEHSKSALSLKGGRLYKADFQVCGFRAIHIVFNKLGRRHGWFFGRRPEFYFPRLPLNYAAIGVILFLPPLALALAILVPALIFEAISK
jgi:hypothetical protein